MLALQSTIGNRAVQRMAERVQRSAGTPAVIQRPLSEPMLGMYRQQFNEIHRGLGLLTTAYHTLDEGWNTVWSGATTIELTFEAEEGLPPSTAETCRTTGP